MLLKNNNINFFSYLLRSFVIIKLKNSAGYSQSSEPVDLVVINDDDIIVDPSLKPSRPTITNATYSSKTLYIEWKLDNNGGSNLTEITVSFLRYGTSGLVDTFNRVYLLTSDLNSITIKDIELTT